MYERFIQGYLPAVWDHLGECVMYQVFNKDGAYVTQYANLSEAETYFRASVPDCEFDTDTKSGDGIIIATDADGNEAGEIRGPKPRSAPMADPGNTSERQG